MAHRTSFPSVAELVPGEGELRATFRTSMGEFTVRLFEDVAPNTVSSFVGLATGKGEWIDPRTGQPGVGPFYDGVVFHRVIPGFMAQGGDPTGTGTGGSELPDLRAEFSDEPHVRGTCSMARTSNPNSANSQFFICFDEAGFLDNQYTVWGEVESGMEFVDALPVGEPPREPGKILKATVA
jgi:peptidylprolyl isomerase